ncbi:translocation/assembly module TamB domain-containing protein [Rhizorhapis sp. SPR117]|uniref:translocation/assembly module TamB domain-containing protein n=1 Tax=Rhizorhapis sp. SPR117 TaxID=2912611 RepID=UPI001F01C320|nr:translocation/assembly module TamB domain-containing protein [Rhizorhapis sp. SPR117]
MTEDEAQDQVEPPRRFRFRWQHWVFSGMVALLLLAIAGLAWLDTGMGHRFVANRIAALSPSSGLKIRIGRIDGSIYKNAVLYDVRFYDPKGLFLSSPRIELDWWPLAWFSNRLDVDRLGVATATLHKWPKFQPSEKKGPILPNFDIRLVDLDVGRLTINPRVAGERHVATLHGRVEIFSGRARVDLNSRVLGGQDRIVLRIDSRPDDDTFDLQANVNAPAGGLIGSLAGLKQRAATFKLDGEGSWTKWQGHVLATVDEHALADVGMEVANGHYRLSGTLQPQWLRGGLIGRLSMPEIRAEASGTFEKRVVSGELTLRSAALQLVAKGGVDLGHNLFDDLRVDVQLLRPAAFVKSASGKNVSAKLRFDGRFDAARFQYLLTAQQLAFDSARFVDLRASGEGRIGDQAPTLIPVAIRARQLAGQGPVVEGIFTHVTLDGMLQLQGQVLTSNTMKLRAAKLDSQIVLLADLATGRYDVALTGHIRNLLIPGLGIVDIESDIRAVPAKSGGLALTGKALANVRRMDNAFLGGLAGGLPRLTTNLNLGTDGQLQLQGLKLVAPDLQLSAHGYRRKDGTFHLAGEGVHDRYGPVQMVLDGKIDRPEVDVVLARPMDAAGLANVSVHLSPVVEGFTFTVEGGSTLGPFDGEGMILLPRGGQAVIDVARLTVSGTRAQGQIRPVTGGLDGRLEISGGGVTGFVALQPVNNVQQVRTELNARNADFIGPPAFRVRRGRLSASILLDPNGTSIDAAMQARGVRRGTMRIGQITANAQLVAGRGSAHASLSGQRGRLFDMDVDADIQPGRITVTAKGTLDRKPIQLVRPAILTGKDDGGWALAPTIVAFAGGRTQLSGELGGPSTQIQARLDRLPLSIFDVYNEDLGLGGVVTGTVSYAHPRGQFPTGKAELRLRGLTRSGLAVSSHPVDVGVNALLHTGDAVARAVIVKDGKTIGRAQARLGPLGDGYILDRLNNAPLFAQLRYNGPADTLWRLTNVETFDLSGPVAVGMDARGTFGRPVIQGSVVADDARFSSPVTGMALKGVKLRGTFSGSRLVLSSFSGTSKGGGTVTGSGSFDLSVPRGIGIDLALAADNVVLLDRDDIGATVTGPMTVQSNGVGGVISGDIQLNRSRFMLGRASAIAEIPELKIIEVRRRGDEDDDEAIVSPWRLDIHANARNRLTVTGLGLDSEWRADLKIGGTISNPTIMGTANLVKGSYEFAGRSFDLEKGQIRFAGNSPVNPNLDIEASANVTDLSAIIHVTGTGLQPNISFTSTPAMPEDELLSRLLFGSSITELSAPEALQLAAAVASLQGGGGGLNPINAVRKAAGLDRLRILPADTTLGQGTSVAAGKYITRRTYVELITDGQGYSATRIEFQITRWLSLLSSISTMGRQSANLRISKDY